MYKRQIKDESGDWVTRYPLFEYLLPVDAMLLVGFLLSVGLLCCYRAGGKLLWVWLMPMAVTIVCSMIFYRAQEHQTNMTLLNAEELSIFEVLRWWVIWLAIGLITLACVVLSCMRPVSRHDETHCSTSHFCLLDRQNPARAFGVHAHHAARGRGYPPQHMSRRRTREGV